MKNTKNQCTNVSTESYTGKEQSPKRFGLSAEGFDINYEKEGFDKLIWVVQLKNNRKVWVRKNNFITITHEEPIIPDIIQSISTSVIIPSDTIDTIDTNDTNDTIDTIDTIDTEIKTEVSISSDNTKPDKKKTDYNIFLKYYLNKLKNEDEYKSTPHKIIFQMATQEWARLKKNPNELKILIEKIKN